MKEQSKIILALLAGAAAGAVFGLLFSPSSGKENREKIAGLANDIIDSAKDLADQVSGTKKSSTEEDIETTLGV